MLIICCSFQNLAVINDISVFTLFILFSAYNSLYLGTVGTEMLTGPCALQKAVSAIFQQENIPTPTIVNLMVSPKGITLTDIQRK